MFCLISFLLVQALSGLSAISDDGTLVQVTQGTVKGRYLTTRSNFTFRAFQGIPYAAPPVGPLRFQAPLEPEPWNGILDATKDGNVCFAIESDSPDESEDCLRVNVFTPVLRNDDQEKLPVLLWIHGGGFSHGNALYSNFGPDFLVEKGIVVVTISYRLGPFGFLATGDALVPGNAGLKDQKAAIKWVSENVDAFGGDAARITICGQSAGGASVGYQLLHNENRGRFRAAILESGSPLSPWSMLSSARSREYAFELAASANNGSIDFQNDTQLVLDFLLALDATALDQASKDTVNIPRPLPVIEPQEVSGKFLAESQFDLLERGEFIRVPIVIGTTSEEAIHQAANLDKLNERFQKFLKDPKQMIPADFQLKADANASIVGNAIGDLYFAGVPQEDQLGHVIKYVSHTSYTTAVIKHADLVKNFTDTFFYVFSYDGPMGNVNVTIKGADRVDHAEDPKYLFQKTGSDYDNEDLGKFPVADVLAHDRLVELWTNFVKYLNPTPESSELLQGLQWPKVTEEEFRYVDIGRNLEVHKNPKDPYFKSWNRFYEEWAQRPFTTF